MPANEAILSLVKATEVLRCICDGLNKTSEIAKKLQYDRTTVYRILLTYEKQGFVAKDAVSRQYYPGHFLQGLAVDPIKLHKILITCSMAEIDDFSREIEETVALQVPFGVSRYLLYAGHSDKNSIFHSTVGNTEPLYTSPGGKMLLSQMDDGDLRALFERIRFLPVTEKTTLDRELLWAHIRQAREQGYIKTFGESLAGAGGIAFPIRNYFCPASITAVGPENRIEEKTSMILKKLERSRNQIELRLQSIGGASKK